LFFSGDVGFTPFLFGVVGWEFVFEVFSFGWLIKFSSSLSVFPCSGSEGRNFVALGVQLVYLVKEEKNPFDYID
jgi:hypothetical protein